MTFRRPDRDPTRPVYVISVAADPSKKISYGELVGGKRFNITLTGANIDATTGVAKVKPVQELENVGKSPRRLGGGQALHEIRLSDK